MEMSMMSLHRRKFYTCKSLHFYNKNGPPIGLSRQKEIDIFSNYSTSQVNTTFIKDHQLSIETNGISLILDT